MNKHNRRARIVFWATSAVLVLCASCGTRQNRQTRTPNIESVIPVPVQTENFEMPASKEIRPLVLNRHTAIVCADPAFAPVAEYLAQKVRTATGYELKIADRLPDEGRNYILLTRTDSVAQAEGYRLVSSPDETVSIAAQAPAGAFYGVQTLLQLLPPEIESPVKVKDVAWELPVGVIDDYPRFEYRGVHFDPSRHFAGVEFIKKQLDILAMFKINRFHWHLTDDQLWTIEIKKYPELTAKGAVRTEGDGSTHRGFYTQDEIREVVAYAAARYIDVIPEIEMPGHAKAALVSHPELSCTGGPFDQPRIIWGVEDDVFCPGKDTTFAFLENVLTEVFELFPSEYLHIGGDECPKVRWKACPDCQRRIRELGLDKKAGLAGKDGKRHTAEELLQSYTITRMEQFANAHGRKIIGWDEILEGGLAPSATVMSWRGEAGGIAAARQQHDVIMTPNSAGFYIDHQQGAAEVEPVSIGGYSTLEKVYGYNPVPDSAAADWGRYIIGVQANLWSEYVLSDAHREYMYYPRVLALAEVDWSPNDRKDWASFQRRLVDAERRLDYHGINYHIPMPEGTLVDLLAFTGDSVAVPFSNTRNLPMVYTLDGSEPTAASEMYKDTLMIGGDEPVVIRIATLTPQGKLSPSRSIRVERQPLKPAAEPAAVDSGVVMRVAEGLFLTDEQIAGARFGADTVVRYFRSGYGAGTKTAPESLVVYEGFVELPEDGVYGFTTDMEELWIDGERIVKNGQEAASRHLRHKTTRALAAGKHAFRLVFNNMIRHGWPDVWNDISFFVKTPSGTVYERVKASQLTHAVSVDE
ncbi:family 20 glycosylhydrolase [uncultured Rikenella sp.]|uniref:family 20 glycosylhydrolase n=1 Tax=uncultured Rikenella sp. TaxID=368003 RepID=UPI002607CAF4|nr:family 20 glycosylhydrolase [uncultured Rikenella sp.]